MIIDITRSGVMGAVLLVIVGNVNGEGSGAAILKGLEKAASGMTGIKKIEVTDAIAEEETSNGWEYVTRLFICRRADLVRRISIEYPATETGYACRVLYDSEKGLETPWYANNKKDYCEPQAVGLVKKHMEMGWACAEQ